MLYRGTSLIRNCAPPRALQSSLATPRATSVSHTPTQTLDPNPNPETLTVNPNPGLRVEGFRMPERSPAASSWFEPVITHIAGVHVAL